MKYLLASLTILFFSSCSSEALEIPDTIDINHKTYNSTISSIPDSSLEAALTVPDQDGAIGRNQEGYFHVRFQLGMNTISDLAVVQNRLDALTATLQTIEYAFSFQRAEGDFEVAVPANLSGLGDPTEGDLASGTAFFGSSLGLTLLSLSNSSWFTNRPETATQRGVLESYSSDFQQMLDYLKRSKSLLFEIDRAAPNRLLFNAVAFHSLGTYLSDQEAIEIARDFTVDALSLQDDSLGYFIEGGGWDSSYNGVALQLGLELYMISDPSDLRSRLKNALEKSAQWQLTRILNSGEINQEGNTRVFEGGESFLGNEKGIDYTKTAKSLMYLSILTGDSKFEDLASRVLDFYL